MKTTGSRSGGLQEVRTRLAVTFVALALVLAACGGGVPEVVFEASGAPLTAATADSVAASTGIGAFASVESSSAPALRAKALEKLRAQGEIGARAAELLTEGFPPVSLSVPVLVRVCQVDGKDAVLVIEAYGDAGGKLTHKRLWVFELGSGAIVRATSFL
jgi:hypothetical protein